jgi:hypothetical protein
MDELNALLLKLLTNKGEILTVAKAIAGASVKNEDKDWKNLIFSAREVLHYGDQKRLAGSAQWSQSFDYELAQSEKNLLKFAKKITAKFALQNNS